MSRLARRSGTLVLGVALAAVAGWAVIPPAAESGDIPPEISSSSPSWGPVVDDDQVSGEEALLVLEGLPVKGRAPKTGFDRGQFGQEWSDDVAVAGGRNGCDTRIICTEKASKS